MPLDTPRMAIIKRPAQKITCIGEDVEKLEL